MTWSVALRCTALSTLYARWQVLVDIVMPEMDGFELLREVRKIPALNHLPMVLPCSVLRCAVLGRADAASG